MMFEVLHRTAYEYDAPVTLSYAELHQQPRDIDGQVCLQQTIMSQPEANHRRERHDYFGNVATVLAIREPHTRFEVTSSSLVDTSGRPAVFSPVAEAPWETFAELTNHDLTAAEFVLDSPLVHRSADLATYAAPSFRPGVSLAAAVLDLNHRIFTDFKFDPKATQIDTPIEEVLTIRRGVCQDFAHVLIGCLRSTGVAACYVSGYLETRPPPGQPRLAGVDRTHAWVGVHLGGSSWIGVDPTNDQIAAASYVTVAHGRDYSDVPPLKGVIFTDSEKSELSVSVDVKPVG